MIETIRISGVATYSEDVILVGLAKVNYLFGSNGSGKTTLSRIILDHSQYPSCELKWENSRPLETLVYNRDFVERHFHAVSEFPGIFTLGEEDAAQMGRIDELKKESAKLLEDIRRLKITLYGEDEASGKAGELRCHGETFQNKCWNVRKQHLHLFKEAFAGSSGSKSAFAAKVLSKRQNENVPAGSLDDLQGRAKTVFDDALTRFDSLPLLTTSDLSALENSPILTKKIIGKTDVDIAALIERLGASDWVRNGLIYVRETNGLCPFCQQPTVPEFQRTLEDYFDDAFESDIASIVELESTYTSNSVTVFAELDALRNASNQFIEPTQFQSLIDSLKSLIKINIERIAAGQSHVGRRFGPIIAT